ncbi:urotensin II-related peptide [Trachinotus anak]|uniref:urotensin II-related peptide n=1 Tax=Trachinotus anak TaxID=443729 RepID=UPI0039F19601
MINRAAAPSVMKVAVMMLMILGMGVEMAPAERGPDHLSLSAAAAPQRSSALNLSQYLQQLLLSPRAAGEDGTAKTTTGAITAGRPRTSPETGGPDKRAQMMKMISALKELHRTFNSTLSSRLTILPRASGRNSGRKNKALSPAEGGVRSTTAPPAAANSTMSRASADANVPSLTGRNFRKSLPPQTKKTNKRVCFWKYCSQN